MSRSAAPGHWRPAWVDIDLGAVRHNVRLLAHVLVGGRRRPIAGTVTMDQILVDCGPDSDVAAGDEVVLLGRQGAEEITAGEWADRL